MKADLVECVTKESYLATEGQNDDNLAHCVDSALDWRIANLPVQQRLGVLSQWWGRSRPLDSYHLVVIGTDLKDESARRHLYYLAPHSGGRQTHTGRRRCECRAEALGPRLSTTWVGRAAIKL